MRTVAIPLQLAHFHFSPPWRPPFYPMLVHQVQLVFNVKKKWKKWRIASPKKTLQTQDWKAGWCGPLSSSGWAFFNAEKCVCFWLETARWLPDLPNLSFKLSPLKPMPVFAWIIKKGKSFVISSKSFCLVQWVGDSVPSWWLCLYHIFHSIAVGLLTVSSHSFMVTSCAKYRKSLVITEVRRSCSQSAPLPPH